MAGAAKPVPDDPWAQKLAVPPVQELQPGPEAQELVSQLNHRVRMNTSELADLTTAQPDAQEMSTLARIWAWIEEMSFEDPGALVFFKDVGADVSVLAGLVGKTVWERMFPEPQPPSAEDVLPFQLRSIVAFQMRQLASRLSGDEYKTARQEGAEACREQRKKATAGKIDQSFTPY